MLFTWNIGSWDGLVSIVTGYKLDGQGPIPSRNKRFFYAPEYWDLLWGHSASYPIGTGAVSLGVKWPLRNADHSSPSRTKVKNGWAVPPSHIHLHAQGQLYLLLETLWCYVLTTVESNVASDLQDETGAEVIIGVSLIGIVVGYENNQASKFYKWVKLYVHLFQLVWLFFLLLLPSSSMTRS